MLGFGPWLVRIADVGPVSVAFWRMMLALPVLLGLTLALGAAERLRAGSVLTLVIGGACLAVELAFWYIGIHHTRLANATLFGVSSGFLFALYGFISARALPSPAQAIALVLAAVGAALLLGRSAELSISNLRGDLLRLAAGAILTGYLISLERSRSVHPVAALTIVTAAGVLPLLAAATLLGERMIPGRWLPILLLTATSQIFGQGLLTYAVGRLPTLLVGLALLLQPLISATIGWLVYHEKLGAIDVAGMVSIAAALVLIHRRTPGPSRLEATAGAGASFGIPTGSNRPPSLTVRRAAGEPGSAIPSTRRPIND
jgi:drug/metabolite transporter (DMT)-like permease